MKKLFISLLMVFSLFCVGCKNTSLIYVEKKDKGDINNYNVYLERDNRIIYLVDNIDEVYYNGMTFKEYLSKTFQTIDDSLSHITSLLKDVVTVRDGGTKIYRSESYDITIITCNKLKLENDSNRDVYIGDYKLEFNSNMCSR